VAAEPRLVHVRICDEATGHLIAATLRITGAANEYFPPLGRLRHFEARSLSAARGGNLVVNGQQFALVDGTCELLLPAGPLLVEISHGPEYQPLRKELNRGAGQIALRFGLTRSTHFAEDGWYSGDTRVTELSPHSAFLEARAEDVAVTNLLARSEPTDQQRPRRPSVVACADDETSNIAAFSGQETCLATPGHLLAVNTCNRHSVLGSLSLLHCHRLVHPLHFGPPHALDDWALADWCRQCHRKGGLVIWQMPGSPASDDWSWAGEALADAVNGDIDAIDLVDFANVASLDKTWYRCLNAGLRLPLACGSGKEDAGTAIGAVRTYARLAVNEALSYAAWIEAVRNGRTFATAGPLLDMTVNGHCAGSVVAGVPIVKARIELHGNHPEGRLELIVNGGVAGSAAVGVILEQELSLPRGGWIAARLVNRSADVLLAHSSPIYVAAEGQPPWSDSGAVSGLCLMLDRARDWVERSGCYSSEREREHLLEVFRQANSTLSRLSSGA
jgi:hypothetical protein